MRHVFLQNCTKTLKKSLVGAEQGGCVASALTCTEQPAGPPSAPWGCLGRGRGLLAPEPLFPGCSGVLGRLLFHSVSNQEILLDAGSQLGNGKSLCRREGSFLHLAGSLGWNQHQGKIRKSSSRLWSWYISLLVFQLLGGCLKLFLVYCLENEKEKKVSVCSNAPAGVSQQEGLCKDLGITHNGGR